MTRILIAEGEPLIASFVQRGLRANGYLTRVVVDPRSTVELAASGEFDLLVIDAGLLGPDDVAALERVFAGEQMPPMLILTAPGGSGFESPLASLTAERLDKPFKFSALLTRVRSLLDREGIPEPTALHVGRAALDLDGHRLTVAGQEYQLSENEFALAEALFRHAGQDMSLEELAGYAGQPLNGTGVTSLEPDFRRLRDKLGSELVTIVGLVGYRLRGNADD